MFRSQSQFSPTICWFESTEFDGDFEHFFAEIPGIPVVEGSKSELIDEPGQIS